MSTRATYTIHDNQEQFHVYKHHDGYPLGGIKAIAAALPFAWDLPRFEGDEFAAAFVAGNKWNKGSDLMSVARKAHADAFGSDPQPGRAPYKQVAFNLEMADYEFRFMGGGVRLLPSAPNWRTVSPGDIQYHYDIRCMDGVVIVASQKCSERGEQWKVTDLFTEPLTKLMALTEEQLDAMIEKASEEAA
jgi:hypothetical protein